MIGAAVQAFLDHGGSYARYLLHGIPIVDRPRVSATGALSNPMTTGGGVLNAW
jgi:hypothetical protein